MMSKNPYHRNMVLLAAAMLFALTAVQLGALYHASTPTASADSSDAIIYLHTIWFAPLLAFLWLSLLFLAKKKDWANRVFQALAFFACAFSAMALIKALGITAPHHTFRNLNEFLFKVNSAIAAALGVWSILTIRYSLVFPLREKAEHNHGDGADPSEGLSGSLGSGGKVEA